MNWNTWDSERIYDRYLNSYKKDVLFAIGTVLDKRNNEIKTLMVYAPVKYARKWMINDQIPAKKYIQSALSNFIKSNKHYKISNNLREITYGRNIDDMIVSNDLQHYINNPDYIVLDFNGVMKHQMELDL